VHLDPVVHASRLLRTDVELTSVLISRPDRLVARLSTRSGDVVLKAAPKGGNLLPEVDGNRRVGAAGVPVAEVLDAEDDEFELLVLRWIEGRGVSSGDSPEVLEDLGRLLRQVHDLGGGPPYARGWTGVGTWCDWMRGWLNTVVGMAPDWGFRADEIERFWERFERVVPALSGVGFDCMLFDGRPEHVLTDGQRIVGFIDLTDVQDGDGGMDLAVLGIQEPGLLASLLHGYQPLTERLEQFRVLVPLYALMRRLSSYEWNSRLGAPLLAAKMLAAAKGLAWEPFPGLQP
jgi:Ser/Thr protein kinase RdoA (MazF antagonist)